MGALGEFDLDRLEILAWCTQLGLLAWVWLRRDSLGRLREPTLAACAIAVLGGWIWRLSYAFALSASGFRYWIVDDPVRWLWAWLWARDPYLVAPADVWTGGTYYLHGAAMRLLGDPLIASKLVSAVSAVLPLAALFVFAQAVFRRRLLSIACVVVAAPSWIDILLSTGAMAEMPTVAAALAGGGLTIMGLEQAREGRGRALLALGAACFAVATMFHMSFWPQLAAILLLLLPTWLCVGRRGPARTLLAWVGFCALATSYCFAWTLGLWIETGDPFAVFASQARFHGPLLKIGGPSPVPQILLSWLGPAGTALLAAALLLGLLGACVAVVARARGPALTSLRERTLARLPFAPLRAVAIATGAALALVATGILLAPSQRLVLPPEDLERLGVDLAVYPMTLAYSLKYLLPLVVVGVVRVVVGGAGAGPARVVLCYLLACGTVLVATAVAGGTNLTPFRTTLPIATALIPFGLAPLFGEHRGASGAAPGAARRGLPWLAPALAAAVLLQLAVLNHRRIVSELPTPQMMRSGSSANGSWTSDLDSLGTWLRDEHRYRHSLRPENFERGVELDIVDMAGIRLTLLAHAIGDPGALAVPERNPASWRRKSEEIIAGMSPDQLLVSDRVSEDPRLRLVVRIGRYRVFERTAEPAGPGTEP